MTINMPKKALLLPLLCGLTLSSGASAGLLNTDFSAGFDSWSAEVTEFDYGTGVDEFYQGDIFEDYPEVYSLSGDSVTISTAYTQAGEAWNNWLYQDVTFDLANDTNQLFLSLSVDSLTTDDDPFFVQLRDLVSNDVLDLSSGGVFDITDWVGLNLTLEFGIIDWDYSLGDELTISGISLSEVAADVPEPAALALFALGLLGLGRSRRNS